VAAAVVAAHNHALRSWLRGGGSGDSTELMDRALDLVLSTWGGGPAGSAEAAPAEDVVVVITRRSTPMWRVVRDVESAFEND
jgi:hypothetical protein